MFILFKLGEGEGSFENWSWDNNTILGVVTDYFYFLNKTTRAVKVDNNGCIFF